jgi:hypothetical protein
MTHTNPLLIPFFQQYVPLRRSVVHLFLCVRAQPEGAHEGGSPQGEARSQVQHLQQVQVVEEVKPHPAYQVNNRCQSRAVRESLSGMEKTLRIGNTSGSGMKYWIQAMELHTFMSVLY